MGRLPSLLPTAIGRTSPAEAGAALGGASVPDDVGELQVGDPLGQSAEYLRLTPADDRDVGAPPPDHEPTPRRNRAVPKRLTSASLAGEPPAAKKSVRSGGT